MTRGVPAQKIKTSAGMRSLQGLGFEFHVPTISKFPDHFKLSLLESPKSSFSCKKSDFSAVCSHHNFQYLRLLQIRNIFLKSSASFHPLSSFTLCCMQSPRSTLHDDNPPVSMINLARHVSNVTNDVINTSGTRHPKKSDWKIMILALATFLQRSSVLIFLLRYKKVQSHISHHQATNKV